MRGGRRKGGIEESGRQRDNLHDDMAGQVAAQDLETLHQRMHGFPLDLFFHGTCSHTQPPPDFAHCSDFQSPSNSARLESEPEQDPSKPQSGHGPDPPLLPRSSPSRPLR